MTSRQVREKYLNFFKSPPRNHKEISPAPLVLENDPTTLFTSSGMQPLVPYLLGEPHPSGSKRLVNSQPSIRLQDIEEVGDNRHTTFFEMLGNWSLGDYFKKNQLSWVWEFFTKELGLSKDKLWVTLFEESKQVPKDEESAEIWKKIGVSNERIFYYPASKNWWSMTGTPEEMQVGHIGGPDSEVFYDFGESLGIHEKSPYKNDKCHPNCECGRFLEIGNSVFIQYRKVSDDKLEELPNKNVDFGGGLERITAAVNNDPDIFKIDVFQKIIERIRKLYFAGIYDPSSKTPYYPTLGIFENIEDQNLRKEEVRRSVRIIADHLRASVFLIDSGVIPSNKLQGYVLRRLIRRSLVKLNRLQRSNEHDIESIGEAILDAYEDSPYLKNRERKDILLELGTEAFRFARTLQNGLKEIEKISKVDGKKAFDLYQTYGFPLEITEEIFEEKGQKFSKKDKMEFEKEFKRHKEQSRTTSAGVFKGGLADRSPEVIRLHTATHLLLASLRKVLGNHVVQKGQNITKERSRFDFPHPNKLTDEELKKVEDMINDTIKKDLPVNFKIMPKDEALKTGAIHAFNEKYADTVKVYYLGNDLDGAFSKEFCGGPHVSKTSEIGRVKIKKQEKIGAGIIRIYLTLESA